MASLSALSLLALSSLICHLAASSEVQEEKTGDSVTLSCQADAVSVSMAEWRRSDLKKEYVFLHYDGHTDSDYQHPSFKKRVELKDKEMKNGNLSVILKNVTKEDRGTYECRFTADDAKHSTRSIKDDPVCIIRLDVEDPGLFFHRPLVLNLKVRPGDDVTLICQAPDVDIAAVEWTRPDLKEESVFLHRDGHIDLVNQPPSFKNRVELKDKEMKNGDLSVILKNVTKEDNGTYECRFKADDAKRRKRAIIETDPISTISLEVVDPDPDHNSDETAQRVYPVAVGLLVPALFIVSVFAGMMHRRQKAFRRDLKKNGLLN